MCALFRFTKLTPSVAEPAQSPPLELKKRSWPLFPMVSAQAVICMITSA
jgi:hypothetical protein